jgi:hypothetical protein
MVGRIASLLTFILAHDGGEVQVVHYIGDEAGQMVLRQPFLKGHR